MDTLALELNGPPLKKTKGFTILYRILENGWKSFTTIREISWQHEPLASISRDFPIFLKLLL